MPACWRPEAVAVTTQLADVLARMPPAVGRRLLWSAALITVAGALVTWEPGATVDIGAVLIIVACAFWGLDNGVTARIEHLAPEHVVALKGVVAGGANLAIGLLVAGWGTSTTGVVIVAALAIGAAGYGASITLWVKGARDLGAARGQVIFATAPFIGAAIAWTVLGERVDALQIAAVVLAAVGVAVSLESGHEPVTGRLGSGHWGVADIAHNRFRNPVKPIDERWPTRWAAHRGPARSGSAERMARHWI